MFKKLSLAVLFVTLSCLGAWAQQGEGPLDPAPPKNISVQELIQRFAEKEKQFKMARDNYTYTQDVKVQTKDCPTGGDLDYREVFDVTFDDRGHRLENVKYAPQTHEGCVGITKEDLDDIRNRLPFVLTSDEIPEYNIDYVGQQREDELNTYVFDIHPKQIIAPKRYFEGRIWVDNQDFQIVKTHGKTVPDIRPGGKHSKGGQENLFPAFTTYREQIDNKYWFPTYTRADDVLHFTNMDVRIVETVKYTNYKRFGSQSKITYEGHEIPGVDPNAPPPPPQQPPQGQQPPK